MAEPRTLRTHPELHSHASFPVFRALGEPRKSPFEKFLSLFADVRAGEGIGVLLLTLNVFLLLGAYYLLKTAREPLILSQSGAEYKSYSSAAQAALLLLLVPIYGWIGTHVNRVRLIAILTLFFISNLAVFYILAESGAKVGIAFYIWVGIFNLFVVSQFWAFANDLYTEGAGRRLFPLIGVGGSVGAYAGASLAGALFKSFHWSAYQLMALAGVILVATIVLTWSANRRETRRAPVIARKEAEAPLGPEGAFELVWKDRYLTWIALLVILLNLVNTCGEYLLGRLVTEEGIRQFGSGEASEAARAAFYGGFFADYYSWFNLLSMIMQMFLVSRLLRYAGVRASLFVLPVIALLSYTSIALVPLLVVVKLVKVLENSTEYSVQNTVRQALFLPVSREAKYKAKAAIDTFCQRIGDMSQAGVVFLGVKLGASVAGFAWLNFALILIWLWVATRIVREHRKRTV